MALALLLAMQGAEVFAAPGQRAFNHSGGRPAAGTHHYHPHPTVIRTVPRYVYVAPYAPYYYSSPSYSSPYYPSASYSTPSYYPPEPPTYVEQPQAYAPPPPPPPSSAQQAAPGEPGPYSMEQGIQYRYLCLDTRRFYPDTKECPSGWLTVLPGGGNPPR